MSLYISFIISTVIKPYIFNNASIASLSINKKNNRPLRHIKLIDIPIKVLPVYFRAGLSRELILFLLSKLDLI